MMNNFSNVPTEMLKKGVQNLIELMGQIQTGAKKGVTVTVTLKGKDAFKYEAIRSTLETIDPDFSVQEFNRDLLIRSLHEMADMILKAGGKR